jgi:hypothetical protein
MEPLVPQVLLVLLVPLDRQVQIQQFLDLQAQLVRLDQLAQQDLVQMRFQSHFY